MEQTASEVLAAEDPNSDYLGNRVQGFRVKGFRDLGLWGFRV